MPKVVALSTVAVDAEANAFARLMDGGYIEIMNGRQPDTADDPITNQRRGVTLRLGTPAFLPAVDGSIIANPITPGTAELTINPATWARIYSSNRAVIMDVSVGTRDAVLVLPSVNIPAGVMVTCSFFDHTVPKDSVNR